MFDRGAFASIDRLVDQTRICDFAGDGCQNLAGAVGGTVQHDHNLIAKRACREILMESSQSLRQSLSFIINRDDHRKKSFHLHDPLLQSSAPRPRPGLESKGCLLFTAVRSPCLPHLRRYGSFRRKAMASLALYLPTVILISL